MLSHSRKRNHSIANLQITHDKRECMYMATATRPVKGMTCSGCVNSVTKALETVPGVQEANVDLQGQKAVTVTSMIQ